MHFQKLIMKLNYLLKFLWIKMKAVYKRCAQKLQTDCIKEKKWLSMTYKMCKKGKKVSKRKKNA